MDPVQVSPHGVTLFYLVEMLNTIETNVLAKGTDLVDMTGRVITAEGLTLEPPMRLELVKRGSFFSMSKARLPGTSEVFEVPRSKLKAVPRSHWTLGDVIQQVLLPEVKERNVAEATVLDHRHVSEKKWGAHYVSAPQTAWFSKLVEALVEHFEGRDHKEVFLWFEPINVNISKLDSDEEFRTAYHAELASIVGQSRDHLVFLDKWGFNESKKNPTIGSLQDAKILWETASAADAGIDTHGILSKENCHEMRQSMRTHGLTYFLSVLANVCFDRASGLASIEPLLAEDGVESAEIALRKQLEMWFVHSFATEVPKLAAKKDILFQPAARAVNRIAVMHSRNGETEAAIELFDYVITFVRMGQGKASPALAYALNNKALLMEKKDDMEGAAPLLREAVSILEEHKNMEGKTGLIVSNLVKVLEALEEDIEAEQMLRKLVRLRAKAFGPTSVECALALNQLGVLQTKLGNIDLAKQNLLEALTILEKNQAVTAEDENLAGVIDNLATIYDLETNHTPDDGSGHHMHVAKTLLNLARVYKETHKDKHSEYGRRGLTLLKEVLGDDHEETKKYEEDLLE